jgi:thioredoxin reductase (NADPH)
MSHESQPAKIAIIGSGPTGYTAAIYLSRARLQPVIFSGREIGGQLMYTTDVENYPGFPDGVEGPLLMFNMRQQAEKFGTQIIDDLVTKVEKEGEKFRVWNTDESLLVDAVLIATGARSRMLGLPQEDTSLGKGLSTCAVCDAAFYRDQKVVVVGGGDSAMEDALALAKFTNQVILIHRKDAFRASRIMQERVMEHPHITVRWNTTLSALHTNEQGRITGVTFQDTVTKAEAHEDVGGVFYAIGHVPSTEFLGDLVQLTKDGYVVTHLGLDAASVGLAQAALDGNRFVSHLTATTTPGVFAAGDCVDFRYRQAITAAAFGTLAALDIERWLE